MENDSNPARRRRGRPRNAPKIAQEELSIPAPVEAAPQEESAPVTPTRPALRTAMREDDPRAAAARRAKEIMGHIGDVDAGTDDFYFDMNTVPDGWTYEWKRRTVHNQEDPAYQVQLNRTGWTPVPTSRHPSMMPIGAHYQTIERKGMVLMERPQEITDQFRRLDEKRAKDQVRVKEDQLSSAPQGQFDRNHPQARPNIKKGFEPMPVPKD